MRFALIAASLIATTACTTGDVGLSPLGQLNTPTNSLIFDSEETAQAGMDGNTCEVDADSGEIGTDIDVAENDDVVIDECDDYVLVLGTDGLHLYEPSQMSGDTAFWGGEFDVPDPTVPGSDLSAGVLLNSGRVVAIRSAGDTHTVLWPGGATTLLPGAITGDLDVDPDGGTLFASIGGDVYAVTPQGATLFASGELVSWDRTAGVAYVAGRMSNNVRVLDSAGTALRNIAIEGQVQDLAAIAGDVGVITGGFRGPAELRRHDGDDGTLLGVQGVRDASARLIASPGGTRLAVTLGNHTQFYAVR